MINDPTAILKALNENDLGKAQELIRDLSDSALDEMSDAMKALLPALQREQGRRSTSLPLGQRTILGVEPVAPITAAKSPDHPGLTAPWPHKACLSLGSPAEVEKVTRIVRALGLQVETTGNVLVFGGWEEWLLDTAMERLADVGVPHQSFLTAPESAPMPLAEPAEPRQVAKSPSPGRAAFLGMLTLSEDGQEEELLQDFLAVQYGGSVAARVMGRLVEVSGDDPDDVNSALVDVARGAGWRVERATVASSPVHRVWAVRLQFSSVDAAGSAVSWLAPWKSKMTTRRHGSVVNLSGGFLGALLEAVGAVHRQFMPEVLFLEKPL